MRPLQNRSIAWGLTISLVLSVTVVSTLALGYGYLSALRSSREALELRSDELTAQLVTGLGPQMWNFDTEGMENIAESYFRIDLVVRLRIWDSFGNLLFEREKNNESQDIDRASDINYQNKTLGKVSVAFTSHSHDEFTRRLLTQGVVTIAAVLLALVLLTGIFLRIFLRRPLVELGRIVNTYAQGRYDAPIQPAPAVEFEPLVALLGDMGARITAQMQEVTAAEANYRAIFENTVEGLFQASATGEIANANPTTAKILGYENPEDLIAAAPGILDQTLTPLPEREDLLAQVRKGAAVIGKEAKLVQKHGDVIWVSLNMRPVFNDNGRLLHTEGSIEDISMRKEAEQTLLNAKEAAESANRLMSELLSMVSHELRTPMTSILGFSKLIDRSLRKLLNTNQFTEQQRAKHLLRIRTNVHIMIDESERLTRLINDVLDLSKLEADEVDWRFEWASPRDIMARAISATMSLVDGDSKNLTSVAPDDLPLVECDHERIIQVLINLISNAVKFTNKGAITCSAEVAPKGLLFSVTDTGVGIAPEQQKLIFDKFKQLGNTLESKPTGTGLGLAICKEIVDRHNGRIWVESIIGQGSRFVFTLPLTQPHNNV